MYTSFHAGIYYDGRNSTYCRPAYFEGAHAAPGFKGHIAHVGYTWHDVLALLALDTLGPVARRRSYGLCAGSGARNRPRRGRQYPLAVWVIERSGAPAPVPAGNEGTHAGTTGGKLWRRRD